MSELSTTTSPTGAQADQTPDHASVVARYLDAWNERDAEQRRALVVALFTDDASFVDPVMRGAGHAAIDALIGGTQARFAGHRFTLAGSPESLSDAVRFRWTLGPADGPPMLEATDFAHVTPDGRVAAVRGFFDHVDPSLLA